MTPLLTIILILVGAFIIGLAYFIGLKDSKRAKEFRIEKKENKVFDRQEHIKEKQFNRHELVKDNNHRRSMERFTISEPLKYLDGFAYLEQSKHPPIPHPDPPITINVKNYPLRHKDIREEDIDKVVKIVNNLAEKKNEDD